ncbi:hypothetical protein PR002_g11937 [Phytophthora rubi]|uniref:Uncharacterized protein n=1 Tax=Phytophthora rubi TaxID=129364 RepID=A0A6A3LWT6_9STRA|nr:hypothetical protein PR002_g11937 [Phytophthora rubi]
MAGRHSIFTNLKIRRLGHTRCHWNCIPSTIAEAEERGVTAKEDDGIISTSVKKKAERKRSASTEALQNKRPAANSPRLSLANPGTSREPARPSHANGSYHIRLTSCMARRQ